MEEPPMTDDRYGLARQAESGEIPAPKLPYLPQDPASHAQAIALIGCGGISEYHLAAYRRAGYHVSVLCDIDADRAEERRRQYYPEAAIMTDYRAVMRRDDVQIVDAALHPDARVPVMEAAIDAGKHVLSQKPFVTELAVGERLCDLADARGVKLAVNQNGRWAPHFSWMRHAIEAGLIGKVQSVDFSLHWDHDWVADTVFNEVEHLLLYDFAIHWFDMIACVLKDREPVRVSASVQCAPGQRSKQPLMGHAMVDFDDGIATMALNGACKYGQEDRTVIAGTKGTLYSTGPELNEQAVTLVTAAGTARPALEGTWFTNGFHGAMAELFRAIEEDRVPSHDARDNLRSLALCFAAVASSVTGKPKEPGAVKRLKAV